MRCARAWKWCAATALATGTAWAQVRPPDRPAQDAGAQVEGQVRAATFAYLYGTLLGDAGEYLKAARLPLTVVRGGAITSRDEKQARALLASIAGRVQVTEAERKQVAANLIALIDEAAIQFVGANTATIAVVTRPGRDQKTGDTITLLVMHRKDGKWQAAAEVTDPAAVPPEYVRPPELP